MACGLALVGLIAWHEGAVADLSAGAAVAVECSPALADGWTGSCAGGYYWEGFGLNCGNAWLDCEFMCGACGLIVDEFDCDEETDEAYCGCRITPAK
jgi:hypothetical protein